MLMRFPTTSRFHADHFAVDVEVGVGRVCLRARASERAAARACGVELNLVGRLEGDGVDVEHGVVVDARDGRIDLAGELRGVGKPEGIPRRALRLSRAFRL